MSRTGIISQKEAGIESTVEWRIDNFLSIPQPHEYDVYYESPLFYFANESWYLRIYPNGTRRRYGSYGTTEGFIDLFLRRFSSGPRMEVETTFGVKTVYGKLDREQHFTGDADDTCNWGFSYNHRPLFGEKSDLLPSGTLTLVCRIKRKGINEGSNNAVPTVCTYCNKASAAQEDIQCHLRKCEDLLIHCQNCSNGVNIKNWYDHKCQMTDAEGSSNTVTKKCSYCNRTFDAEEDIQSHLQECEDLPIKCRKCNNGVALKNWYKHECHMTDAQDEGVVCQDLKKMLSDGQNHDLTLKVGDKELRAHQDVLKARCPVFESMLNHDMAEKKSGVIDIPDCDPQAMELFLLYVYCGKVETLDQTNMLGLYYIADKYDMQSLKQKCCGFIQHSLSHTNICEVIQLALTHSDTNLLEYATNYFIDNTVDIMLTVEWQNFMKDNATVANELMLKSFRKVKDSKN